MLLWLLKQQLLKQWKREALSSKAKVDREMEDKLDDPR